MDSIDNSNLSTTTVYHKSFIWRIPNYNFFDKFSQKFHLTNGINLIIDLSASHNNEKGHRKPEISVKPLFYFENIPKDVQKLVKVLVTSSNANAASYLPYSELCQGKPSLTQSNFKFLDLKNIQKCLEGNTLVLFIDVHVKDPELVRSQNDDSSQLSDDFSSLFDNSNVADFTFVVDNREFPVHKALISARSPVLRSMLENETLKKFVIENVEADVFSEILRFIYTDKIQGFDEHFKSILEAGHRFKVVGLKPYCEAELLTRLTDNNAVETFELAHLHQFSVELKLAAFESIQKIFVKFGLKMPVRLVDEPDKVLSLIGLKSELREMIKPIKTASKATTAARSSNQSFPLKLRSFGNNNAEPVTKYAKKPGSVDASNKPDSRKQSEVTEEVKMKENHVVKPKKSDALKKQISKKRRELRKMLKSARTAGLKSEVVAAVNDKPSDKISDEQIQQHEEAGKAEEAARVIVGITVPPVMDEAVGASAVEDGIQVSDKEKPKVKGFLDFLASLSG